MNVAVEEERGIYAERFFFIHPLELSAYLNAAK